MIHTENWSYVEQSAWDHLAAGMLSEAHRLALAAIELNPSTISSHTILGQLSDNVAEKRLIAQKIFHLSEQLFMNASARDEPDLAEHYGAQADRECIIALLAAVFWLWDSKEARDKQDAIDVCLRCVKYLRVSREKFRAALATFFAIKGDWEAAWFQAHECHDCKSVNLCLLRSLLAYQRGITSSAEDYLRQANEINPYIVELILSNEQIDAMGLFVGIYVAQGSIEEARLALARTHEMWKELPGALAFSAELRGKTV